MVTIIECPLRDKSFSNPSEVPCFTETFATGLERCKSIIIFDFLRLTEIRFRVSWTRSCQGRFPKAMSPKPRRHKLSGHQTRSGTVYSWVMHDHRAPHCHTYFQDGLAAITRRLATHEEIAQKEKKKKNKRKSKASVKQETPSNSSQQLLPTSVSSVNPRWTKIQDARLHNLARRERNQDCHTNRSSSATSVLSTRQDGKLINNFPQSCHEVDLLSVTSPAVTHIQE